VSKLAEYVPNGDTWKVTEFVRKYGTAYDPKNDEYKRDPFTADVKAGKNTLVYNAHSYHTKVPPEGIRPFIRHYTSSGDLVLDPFCGSGMTGIAALAEKRIPILIELSPAATFIAYNYCAPVEAGKFSSESERVLDATRIVAEWLYQTKCERCGGKASVNHIVWSDKFACPRCNNQFLLFDVAVQGETILKKFRCPNCDKELKKADCDKTGADPVKINYSCPKCGRIEDKVKAFDVEKVKEIERRWKQIQYARLQADSVDGIWPLDRGKALWFPNNLMMSKGEKWGDTWRAGYHKNIVSVDQFFTIRNLWMLATLFSKIAEVENTELRQKIQWVFTSTVEGSSRLNRERVSGLPSKLSGTLYVSSLYREINVFKFFGRKIKRIATISKERTSPLIVATQTATDLSNVPSDSIDYVFTDPPFGGNLMYSELNFIWESWLGRFTDTKEEAVMNRSQAKGLAEYKDLMTRSFKEIYRVLKPSRWMTMVFHNSDGKVWQAIQEGLSEAGFVIGMIGIFDKKQRSFKQVTSSGAVGYDVVVNCNKPKATIKNGIEGKTTKDAIVGFLADYLQKLPLTHGDERTARMLHSKAIGFFMLQNRPLEKLGFEDFQVTLKKNFRSIDGFWYLPYQRPRIEGQRRLFGFITTEAEAIEWLEELLRVPRKQGDITPEFFKALGPQKLQKELEELLQENFVEEKGIWRNPTTAEKERLIKRLTDKTARQIDEYLKGTIERSPTETELCEWIEFCYNSGLYQEGSDLLHHINEEGVTAELFKKTKKIAEVCKIKAWEGRQE